jgi:hypothetical protein
MIGRGPVKCVEKPIKDELKASDQESGGERPALMTNARENYRRAKSKRSGEW